MGMYIVKFKTKIFVAIVKLLHECAYFLASIFFVKYAGKYAGTVVSD